MKFLRKLLVAMATVHEKFQMTFPMKVLSQFHEISYLAFTCQLYKIKSKKFSCEIQDGRHAHIW